MQYKVAKGAMSFIARLGSTGMLDLLGISEDDFHKVTASVPWVATDRNRVSAILNTLIASTIDIIGVPRFKMPAEYIAAGIALFVAPINVHVACRFMERSGTAEHISKNEYDEVSAEQLFSIIVQLVGDSESSNAIATFEKNTGLRIRQAEMSDPMSKIKKGGG